MIRYLLTAGLLFAAMPAMAQPASPPQEPPCLRQVNMYDFKIVPGNRSLIITDRSRVRYRVNFIGQCYNIQYRLGIRFKTNGTSNLSCVSKGDSVLYRDPAGPGFCIVRDVQYQTPQMDQKDMTAAAAPKQQ